MRNLFPHNTPHMLAAIIGCVTLTACGGGGAPDAQVAAVAPAPADAAPGPVITAGLVTSSTVNTTYTTSSPLLLTPTTALTPTAIVGGAQITDLRFENTGAAQTGVPVTFGHAFAVGAVANTASVAGKLPDGTMVPLQLDVKARHADGSVRHAVISAVLPALAAAQTLSMALVKTAPYAATSAATPSALLAAGFTAAANVTLAGQKYSASADQLLKGAKVTAWLTGAIVNEWHVSAPLKNAQGVAHPHLTARFAVRFYNGSKKTRVDVTIENNWAYEPAPQNFTYDAEILVGGKPVFAKADLTHFHHARWRKLFWWGGEPAVHIKHNTAYLIDSKAVPNYDRSIVIPETTLASMKTRYSGAKTEIMGVGEANPYMPSTGGRQDIGLLPGWSATYLLSMDKRAKDVMLGTGDLSGSWSSHYRNKTTDRPVSVMEFPYMSVFAPPGDTVNPVTKKLELVPACATSTACKTPNDADTSHQPSLAYLPYLVTGDYYYLEELQFWAMWNTFAGNPAYRQGSKGLYMPDQVRGQGWSMRTLAEAAWVSPDVDPLKSHFESVLKSNLDWYNENYTNNPAANRLGILSHGYAVVYDSGTGIAPWQDDFFTAAIGRVVELGYSQAKPLLAWKTTFAVSRMTDPGACWIEGASYSLKVRDSATSEIYDTIAKAYKASHTAEFNALECGGAAMAAALKLRVGEMTGYSSATVGHPSTMQAALAYSVDNNTPNAAKAWSVFMARSVKPDYSTSPPFAVVPR